MSCESFHHIYIFVAALIMADDVTDTLETRRYPFLHHKYCSATFWEEERGNFVGDGLFHHSVAIGERYVATTIDGSSSLNLISIEVVEKLQLPTSVRRVPYLLCSSYGTLLISYTADVPITIGEHTELVPCDVSPMPLHSCHVLLGDSWCRKFKVQPCRDVKKVSLKWNMKRCALLRTPADKFHEYHLTMKERTTEFSLSAKHKVIMDGDMSIICIPDQAVHHNPCENESHIAKLSESVIKSELCDSTLREVESIHFESMREKDTMSVVDGRTCEDSFTNVIISTFGVVSFDMQVTFEEREHHVVQPASPLEKDVPVPTTSEEDDIDNDTDLELQPATENICESTHLLVTSCDLSCSNVSEPCDNLLNSNFDHVVLMTHKEVLSRIPPADIVYSIVLTYEYELCYG